MKRPVALALWSGVIVVVAAALIVGVFRGTFAGYVSARLEATAVQTLKACAERSDLIACARPTLAALLEHENGSVVMRLLADNFPAQTCHYMGHVVGQDLFLRYHDPQAALAQCSADCSSACAHGVIGEDFIQIAGIDADFDPAHLSADDIHVLGTRLCALPNGCHAVGHALYLAYQDVGPSLTMCANISTNDKRTNCDNGVFMEYTNELASKSAWKEGVPGTVPSADSLATFCDWPTAEERNQCFSFFPWIVIDTLTRGSTATTSSAALTTVVTICAGLSDPQDRYSCINAVGQDVRNPILTTPRPARMVCDMFPTLEAQKICVSGIIDQADQFNKANEALSFCGTLDNGSLRESCYIDVFAYLPSSSTAASVATHCPAGDPLCLQASVEYKTNAANHTAAR